MKFGPWMVLEIAAPLTAICLAGCAQPADRGWTSPPLPEMPPPPPPPPAIPEGAVEIKHPVWLRRPAIEEYRAAAPTDVPYGGAMLLCRANAAGGLVDCEVRSQRPSAGGGAGEAALKLVPRFLLRVPQPEATPIAGAYVYLPIDFDVDGPAPVLGPPVAPGGPRVVTEPNWLRPPTGDDVARYYPSRAQTLGKEGRAAVRCTVTFAGRLADCELAYQDPPDLGFDDGALRMSRLFRMRPWTADGTPVEGAQATLSIRFTLGGGAPPPESGAKED